MRPKAPTLTAGGLVADGDGHALAAAILDPVLNGPYDVPIRHFVIGPKGPTGEVRTGRRPSESFIPVAPVRKRGRKPAAKEGMPRQRPASNSPWVWSRSDARTIRSSTSCGGTSPTDVKPDTRAPRPQPPSCYATERENRILFAQREAAETAIFLSEVAGRTGRFRDRRASSRISTTSTTRASPALP